MSDTDVSTAFAVLALLTGMLAVFALGRSSRGPISDTRDEDDCDDDDESGSAEVLA